MAKKRKYNVNLALWDTVLAMFERAHKGDVAAAKLVLDRFCGVQEKESVNVQLNQAIQQHSGTARLEDTPTEELSAFVGRLKEIAEENGTTDS